jgi:AraC-like DNA-binding protein
MLLDMLVQDLSIDFEPFTICRVGAQTGLDMGRVDKAALHFVTSGHGFLRVDGRVVSLDPGVVLITYPGARLQALSRHAGGSARLSVMPCRPIGELQCDVDNPDDSDDLVLVCGALDARYRSSQGLFDHLDRVLVERLELQDEICSTLSLVVAELEDQQVGAQAMARSLLERCLILILRRECQDGDYDIPWLSALRDERMSRALGLLRTRITVPPSVAELAETAGMARSTFLRHFRETFGLSPRALSVGFRMERAATILRTSDAPVKSVAAFTGFQSRSHFSRSFRRRFDQSPDDYRRGVRAVLLT